MSREAAPEGWLRIVVDADAVAYAPAASSRSRADHGHKSASSAHCVSLAAHATIETVRNVLDQEQDAERFACHVSPLLDALPSTHGLCTARTLASFRACSSSSGVLTSIQYASCIQCVTEWPACSDELIRSASPNGVATVRANSRIRGSKTAMPLQMRNRLRGFST